MNDSWIALVDLTGLKLLVRENDHASLFLLRRASRENAECFWAVLEPRNAQFVERLRRSGHPAAAVRWLEYLATDLGRMTPSEQLLPPWLPEDVTIPDEHDKEWTN